MVNHGSMTEFNQQALAHHQRTHAEMMRLPKLPLPPEEEPDGPPPEPEPEPPPPPPPPPESADYTKQADALAKAFDGIVAAVNKMAAKPEPSFDRLAEAIEKAAFQLAPERQKRTVTFPDGREASIEPGNNGGLVVTFSDGRKAKIEIEKEKRTVKLADGGRAVIE
jgi:hypothetical protein